MNALASLRTALRALTKNKLRSMLAMLGIVIAVSAVVATVAIGQGAQAKVAQQMGKGGVATGTGAQQSLTRDDATAIEREVSDSVSAVSPVSRTSGQVLYGGQNWFTSIQGVSPSYLDIRNAALAEGQSFTREQDAAAAKVAIIGKTVADKLFPNGAQIVGEQIRVKQEPVTVIGVLAPKGQSAYGQDQDDVILMPWTTVVRRLIGSQSDTVGQIMVLARSASQVDQAQSDVRNLAEMQDAAKQSTQTVAVMLGSVALISLIVGAIGIANVMLVSVTERTREIGLRMAIGGRGRDVLYQFLIEAMSLAVVGGLVGLLLGTGASKWMAAKFDWPSLLSVPAMAATLLLAGLAGVVAGFYPALRASRLDPIEALRFE